MSLSLSACGVYRYGEEIHSQCKMASVLKKDCVKTGFGKQGHSRLTLVNNQGWCPGVVFFNERIVRIT